MATAGPLSIGKLIRARSGNIGVILDSRSGLPAALVSGSGGNEEIWSLQLAVTLVSDGDEVDRAPYGLDYVGTRRHAEFHVTEPSCTRSFDGSEETFTVATEAGDWSIWWNYTFRPSHPRLQIACRVAPLAGQPKSTLRDMALEWRFQPADLADWRIEAPGNALRPGVAALDLLEPLQVSTAGGVLGSSGLVALHRVTRAQTLLFWPIVRTEIGRTTVQARDHAMVVTYDTGLAGRLAAGETLHFGDIYVDALDHAWSQVRDSVPSWHASLGIATPRDRAEWIERASIYEVQIGTSVFWRGYAYAPYPTVHDLIADLGRIDGLGYNVLQIMPRQPYPSYNVHDYADISTSYGDETELRTLVAAAHELGMHVILDILLHGVMDREVMAHTAHRVRTGPYGECLEPGTAAHLSPAEQEVIPWCRHILDFEPHWHAGSPDHHRLVDEHPDWFMRDSAGRIIGIYTKAFDVANPSWQEYFIAATEHLVRRLDVDGFRFDAPTYNDLPNWSPATEQRASYSPLGALVLFDKLRERLKASKQQVMLYTEPSGVLFRQAMDVTYNYDEQWLIGAVLRPAGDDRQRRTGVRHGRDLAAWFRDRNAVLPPGSLTAHHIDSHDTFWWPLPGKKWRREQFGLPATRALLAIFALSGGAYMTFVGGEDGIEDDVRRVHRLRHSLPELLRSTADFEAVDVDSDTLYAVARPGADGCSVLLVNLSEEFCRADCTLHIERLHLDSGPYTIYDAWSDQDLARDGGYSWPRENLSHFPLSFEPYEPRLLVVRPVRR